MKHALPAGEFFHVPESLEQELEDLRTLLRLPGGRRLFRRLLAVGNVLGPSMGRDGRGAEYNEGIRAVGLWLAAKIETAAPGDVARLMLESGEDKRAANAITAKAAGRRERQRALSDE